jgi:hypothetical protein
MLAMMSKISCFAFFKPLILKMADGLSSAKCPNSCHVGGAIGSGQLKYTEIMSLMLFINFIISDI